MLLFPTDAQVCDMLQCAKDRSTSDSNSASSFLTFGEFCKFATELKRCYDRRISCSVSMNKLLEKDGKERKKQPQNKISKSMPEYEVFLGGSCNPTTWRQDVAIPLLNKLGISYFNPQVDHWNPDLIEIEYRAKEDARILFYVINSETRNVAGIIEAAHMAGMRRKLILVADDYREGQTLCGETISQQECEELNASIQLLKVLVWQQGIPVFNNIPSAIKFTAKVLEDDDHLTIRDVGTSANNTTNPNFLSKFNNYRNGDTLTKIKEAFNSLDKIVTGKINLSDVYLAGRILLNRRISVPEMKRIIASHSDSAGNVRTWKSFEEFCLIVSDLKTVSMSDGSSAAALPSPTNIGANGKINAENRHNYSDVTMPSTTIIYDVYIHGGNYYTDCSWAEDVVIPKLRKNNLSHYYEDKIASDGINRQGYSVDAAAVNNCYIMLFYVPRTVRGLTTMAMAAHYIGLGCNVVLCIQKLIENDMLVSSSSSLFSGIDDVNDCGSDQVNIQSVSDYNRGRMYLTDLARRDDIPVFEILEDAVECIIQKCT